MMALMRTFLLILVFTVIYNSQESKADFSALNSQDGFSLENIIKYFGLGGDNGNNTEAAVSEDQQALLDIIQGQSDTKKEYNVPASAALARRLLYKLKSKASSRNNSSDRINSIKDCEKSPISIQVIQSVIADCVKDIIQTINSNSTLIPVDKAKSEESRKKVQKLFDGFLSKLEHKFDALKQVLDSINNPKFNVNDIKKLVEEIISDSKIKIESLVEFFNGTSGTFDNQLKNVKEIIRENVQTFTEKILSSNCISVRESKTAFCKCIEPIFNEFTNNLTNSIEQVDELSKSLQLLGREAIKYVESTIEKVLKAAEEKAKTELEKVINLVQPNPQFDNEEFLRNRSSDGLKQIEVVINGPFANVKNILKVVNQNVQNSIDSVLSKLNSTQNSLREAISTNLADNPGQETEKLEQYLENKTTDVKQLVNQTIDKITYEEKELENLENKIKSLLQEYSADNVNDRCKKENANIFFICVNTTYNKLNLKLNPVLDEIQKINSKINNTQLENELTDKLDNVLEKASEDAKNEAKRITDEAEVKKINNQYAKDVVQKSAENINSVVNPLVNKIDTIVNDIKFDLDKITPSFVENITSIITSLTDADEPLNENDNEFIKVNVDKINKLINEYKNQLNENQNEAKVLDNNFKNTSFIYSEQYLKQKCEKEFTNVNNFAACGNSEISILEKETENVVINLDKVLDNLNNVTLKVTINNEITNLLQKANEVYTAKKLDKNNPEDSAERISQCLELVNVKANQEVQMRIEQVFAIPKALRENINEQVEEAVQAIQNSVTQNIEALDKLIEINPDESAKYNKRKEELNNLLQESENKIKNNADANLNKLSELELGVNEQQTKLSSKLAEFTEEVLNKSCEVAYKSKATFSQCIDKECGNFNQILKEIEKNVVNLEANAKGTLKEVEKDVFNTIQEVKGEALLPNTQFLNEIYLKNQIQNILKNIEAVKVPAFNKVNNLNEQVQNIKDSVNQSVSELTVSQEPLREAINKYLGDKAENENVRVDNEIQEKVKAIVQLGNDVIGKTDIAAETLKNVKNSIIEIVNQYSEDKINKKCESDDPILYSTCVDSLFEELNLKLEPLALEIENFDSNKIEEEVNNVKDQLIKIVEEAADKAKSEAEQIKNEAETKLANNEYVKIVLKSSEVKINTQVNPAFDNAVSVLKKLNSEFDNVPAELEKKLADIILNSYEPGETLSENDKVLIKENIANVNELIDKYKNQIQNIEKGVGVLSTDFNLTKTVYDKIYIENQCREEASEVYKYKVCVDNTIANLDNNSDTVVQEIKDLVKNVTDIKTEAAVSMNKIISFSVQTTTEVYTMSRLAKDQNNATTSAGFISECLESVDKIIKEKINILIADVLATDSDIIKFVKEQSDEFVNSIRAAYNTQLEAIDFAIVLNSNDNCKVTKYNKQKLAVNVSINDAVKRVNDNLKLNLESSAELKSIVNQIKSDLLTRQTVFIQNLNKSCESVYNSKKNFSNCIDEECKSFNKYLNETENKLNELSSDANVLFFDVINNVTSNIQSEQSKAEEVARNESEALFKENNVNQDKVINLALSELGKINITAYRYNVNLINSRAIDLRSRQNSINSTGINSFSRISLLMSLHISVVSQICPKVQTKSEAIFGGSLIQAAKDRVFPLLPNNTEFVIEQLNLASNFETKLKNQIQLLQPDSIKSSCSKFLTDMIKMFQCVKGLVKNFGDFFTPALADTKFEAQDALYELQNRTILLTQWRDNYVAPEIANLTTELGPIPESVYSGECNATKEKLLNYAEGIVNQRYNRLKPILANLEKNVSAAADQVLAKNYTNIVNIYDKLNGSMDYLRIAIEAAKQKNSSYVTQTLLSDPDKNIGIGVGKFLKFTDQIPINASIAKANAKVLLAQSLERYQNISSNTSLSDACYKDDINRPMTSFVVCNNNNAYNFELALVNIQNILENSAKELGAINYLDGKKLVEDYANKLEADAIYYSATFAIRIYNDNKIPIPDYLLPWVKSGCVVSSGTTCIIVQ